MLVIAGLVGVSPVQAAALSYTLNCDEPTGTNQGNNAPDQTYNVNVGDVVTLTTYFCRSAVRSNVTSSSTVYANGSLLQYGYAYLNGVNTDYNVDPWTSPSDTFVVTINDATSFSFKVQDFAQYLDTTLNFSVAPPPAPTTTLTASPTNTQLGGMFNFTATVSPAPPDGSLVTFKDGTTSLGTDVTASGTASFSTFTLSGGTHTITAVYTYYDPISDDNLSATSSPVTVTVQPAASVTTLTASSATPVPGESVTFTATVSYPDATGTVTFKEGGTTLGTGTVSGGVATFTTSWPSTGDHLVRADYSGDHSYLASSAVDVNVTVGSTTTTLTTSSATPAFGTSVTFTATVAPSSATGTVTFRNGPTTIGTGTISGGVATFTTSSLGSGPHSITAVYGGSGSYATSTSSVTTVTVGAAPTTTTLTSSSATPAPGASVTFTATIIPSNATGTVTFMDGATTLGTGNVSGGVATFTTSSLSIGPHNITAVYGGSGSYATSTSSAVNVTVGTISTTTTLNSSSNTPTPGASVTFTATITPSAATGTVTFMDGATILGTGTVSGGVATYTTSSLSVGSHSITAVYGGNASYATSTSSVTTVTVSTISTTTALTSSSTTPIFGTNVTFTATITPSAATGMVTFKNGNLTLGTGSVSGGVATYTTSSLSVGSHSITAIYSGDSVYASSTSSPVIVAPTRPNPVQDPNVRGIAISQVSMAMRTAQQTISTVEQRLETIHGDDTPGFTNGISLNVFETRSQCLQQVSGGASNQQGCSSSQALNKGGLGHQQTGDAGDQDSSARMSANAKGLSPEVNAWTAGSVIIGDQSYTGQVNQNRFSVSGVTAGLDTRVTSDMKAGFAVGLSSDRTTINNDAASNNGTSVTGTAYVSWRATKEIFVDGLVGYGNLNFSSSRYDTNALSYATGNRSGSILFGSLITSLEQRIGSFKYAPYGGFDMMMGRLNAYTETGDANWVLSYAPTSLSSQGLILGLRGQYDMQMSWGTLSPIARAQFRHGMSGDITQSMNYAADTSTSYNLAISGAEQNNVSSSIGLRVSSKSGLSGQLEYINNALINGSQSNGMRAMQTVPF